MTMKPALLASVLLLNVHLGGAMAQTAPPASPGLTLSSPEFPDGSVIPDKFTQADPKPVSPKLAWTNVPPNTASFALVFIDADSTLQKTLHGTGYECCGPLSPLHIPALRSGH